MSLGGVPASPWSTRDAIAGGTVGSSFRMSSGLPLSFSTPLRSRADGYARHIPLERKLARALKGDVRFDAFTRGRYATDASIYQIMPTGVVFPKNADDLQATL